jgi:flagellar biosynthesis/type III secretory pathway protein FliH
MSNYRETRRSEADWEQFATDQREYIESMESAVEEARQTVTDADLRIQFLEAERDGWKNGFEKELRVSRRLREYLDRLETEVERLKNIQEHYVKGVWDPND